tara:strand:- start:238 stop:615 length:378 start_codon:yes stop_codon:yes gene_type:complete
MKFRCFKKIVDIKETETKNTHSVDYANRDKSLNDAVADLKRKQKKLLKSLELQKRCLDNVIAICKIIKDKMKLQKTTGVNSTRGDFINYEEKKKFENMLPIDTESINSIDWDRLLKELCKYRKQN